MAGETILIVEDERAVARGLEYGLTSEGFRLLWAKTGTEALDLIGRHDPYIPLSHAERLQETIADSRLVIVKDGGHFLPMDTPEAIAREINTFIG